MSYLPDRALEHLRRLNEPEAPPGERYTIEEEIGRGGMGVVYRAWDSRLERKVALKVADALPEPAEEAKILARLGTPGLVPVYDAGTLADGRVFYAMRLVEGQRLDRFLEVEQRLRARLRVFGKICEAVAFAHDHDVVHCDLKPLNVMVGRFGEVFVMDWGAARAPGAEGAAFGTPPYMAPERDSLDLRADVFALGRILADLAPERIDRPLAAVIAKATSARREERYPAVEELAADVTRYLDGLPVSAYRESLWDRGARFTRRNQILLLLLAAYLVVKMAAVFLPYFFRP